MQFRFLLASSLCVVALSCSAFAKDDIRACTEIESDQERLACFDAATAQLKTPATAETTPTVDETPEKKQRRLFGFREPKKPAETVEEFGKVEPPKKTDIGLNEISSTISEVQFRFDKASKIVLANGQTWQQLSSDSTLVKIRSPETKTYSVTIKKGALGSYRMTIEPIGRTIRVRRLQ